MLAQHVVSVAIGWQVYSLTKRALDLGFVGLAQFLPAVLLSLVTGQVADRFDRRRILLLAHVVEIATVLVLFWLSRIGMASPMPVYITLFVFGTARAFSGPAGQALAPNLVARKDLPQAVGWSTTVWQLATIAGPALAGLLYGIIGPHGSYLVAAVLFSLSFVCLFGIATRRPTEQENERAKSPEGAEPQSKLQELFAGLRYVFHERAILGTISLDLFAVLLGGAVALLPMFAERLAWGPTGLGLLRSAPAVGATTMAIFLSARPLKRHAGVRMLGAVFVFGLCTIVFALSKSFALSLIALVVLGAADMVSVVVRRTLLQVRVPDAMRGRVYAVGDVFVGASNELGEFESGVTAEWLGPVQAALFGGIGTLVVVALWAGFFPDLRRIDRIDSVDDGAS